MEWNRIQPVWNQDWDVGIEGGEGKVGERETAGERGGGRGGGGVMEEGT